MREPDKLKDLVEKIDSDGDLKSDGTKGIMQKKLIYFLNDIMTGKIDNKEDAEREYLERIIDYKDLLQRERVHPGKRAQTSLKFIKDAEYAIFGIFIPKKKSDEEQSDMPELESEQKLLNKEEINKEKN